jgi:hypothetical protein
MNPAGRARKMKHYWNYYDEKFDWDDSNESLRPDLDLTRKKFDQIGLSQSEIEACVSSGYVILENDVVIDRFYGGALLSADMRTRFPLDRFLSSTSSAPYRSSIRNASSMADLLRNIDDLKKRYRGTLLYRGQTSLYPLQRERPNPFFEFEGIGEISLLPSLWRIMQKRKPHSFLNFQSLTLFEWSKIIYSGFDLAEIERRQNAINASGGWVYTAQDMEDSDDPLLQAFGRVRSDLQDGLNFNLADLLATLLQHYGLYSPALDLTSELEVALFFSTHRVKRSGDHRSYEFVGANDRGSVLFVFKQEKKEMHEYEHERALDLVKPLRPQRQSCVICRTGTYALNLAAYFLIAAIRLDFDLTDPGHFSTHDLFPTRAEDRFLEALKTQLIPNREVTEFT